MLGDRDPGRRAAPGGRQRLAREREQRPPHGELLHDGAVVVQGCVDVGEPDALRAGEDRQVHAGGLGRVQRDDGTGGVQRRPDAAARRQCVPGGQTRPPLGVGDVPNGGVGGLHPRNTLWLAAWARGRITSRSMLTWAGRVAIQAIASATSSATNGSGTPSYTASAFA